jgi:penicillin-binding protein 1A
MPEVLVDAIIATEDSRFFQHNGFDLPRFMKASFGQLLGHSDAGGASTLTMQIVKNHYTSPVSSGMEGIMRKFTDIYMAIFQIEKKYTKKEILEFYINSNYLGGGAYGVEQACLTYFGKNAKDINLAEAAMIAGLFQAPNSYDPYINPELTESRRQTVLYLMERHGYITKEERKIASKVTVPDLLVNTDSNVANKYQGFIDTVTAEVQQLTKNDPYVVPMEIYTTMDKEKQNNIYDIFSGSNFKWENDIVNAGVSVIDVHNGSIVAVGSGRNSVKRGFNNATMIKRQVGSTAKPLYDYDLVLNIITGQLILLLLMKSILIQMVLKLITGMENSKD